MSKLKDLEDYDAGVVYTVLQEVKKQVKHKHPLWTVEIHRVNTSMDSPYVEFIAQPPKSLALAMPVVTGKSLYLILDTPYFAICKEIHERLICMLEHAEQYAILKAKADEDDVIDEDWSLGNDT